MDIRNPVLYAALRNYLEVGLALLSGRCGPEQQLAFETTTWVRTSDRTFARQVRQTPSWTVCIHRLEGDLHALPEYANLLEVITRDSTVRPQMGVLVGSPLGQQRIDLPTIADGLMTQVADRIHELRFDEATLLNLYEPMERALYDEFIEYEATAPILSLSSVALPIRLDSETVLDTMTDEEIANFIRTGLIVSPFGDFGMVFLQSNCGVRRRYRLPKVIGEAPPERTEEASAVRGRFEDTLLGFITALRLFKAGEVISPGFVEQSTNWLMRGHVSWQPLGLQRRVRGTYQLSQEESEFFARLWNHLRSEGVRRNRALSNALRRFRYAGDRERPDDRIVDLMIAAESVFLSDTGDPQSRGELRYRLALRSSFFVEIPGRTRRQVFDLMRRAYDTRSEVVHGEEVDSVTLQGEQMPLGAFSDLVEEHLRAALRKGVEIAADSPARAQLVDWEDLIIGAPEE